MVVSSPAAAKPFRPWRDLRWITGAVVAAFIGGLAWNLFGPEPPIRVSRETTFLTEPLAADGLPDYEAAILAMHGPAPPPDENAAVLLLQACWPLEIDAADLPTLCTALGIPHVPPAERLREPGRDAASGVTDEMLERIGRPWPCEPAPELVAWLRANAPLIDRMVEAAARPRYWLASPSLLDAKPDMAIGMPLPDIQAIRSVARILSYRASVSLAENRPADAWRDVAAIHRLARLLVPGAKTEKCSAPLVTQLVAIAIDGVAQDLTRRLVSLPDLPADVLAAIRRDIDSFGPPVVAAGTHAFERVSGIDAIVWMARRAGGRAGRWRLIGHTGLGGVDPTPPALFTSLDWNVVLARTNAAYDELETACRLPTHADRVAELRRQEQAIRDRVQAPRRSAWTIAGDLLMQACNRGHRSERVGDVLLDLLMPVLSSVMTALGRAEAEVALTRTAAALAAWRADREPGAPEYPERLDDLVPRYLAAVPVDPFTDQPLVYERRDAGYLLASVGQNGVYDGGTDWHGWIVGGEWQEVDKDVAYDRSDQVVRMPMPRRKVQPP